MSEQELIVATTNPDKVKEVRNMLGDAVTRIKSTLNMTELHEPEETGESFRENAEIKAKQYYEQVRRPVLTDDSGLCVEALNGAPGVHSARFSGPNASDMENNEKLLDELAGVPYEKRDARFECCLVLCYSDRLILTTKGICPGKIRTSPSGKSGFGYDPLFEPRGYDRTFGEMSAEEKNNLSHRADAIGQLHVLVSSKHGQLWGTEMS